MHRKRVIHILFLRFTRQISPLEMMLLQLAAAIESGELTFDQYLESVLKDTHA